MRIGLKACCPPASCSGHTRKNVDPHTRGRLRCSCAACKSAVHAQSGAVTGLTLATSPWRQLLQLLR
jgi:hypothetical protein